MTHGTPVSRATAIPADQRMYAVPAAPYEESMLPYSFSICDRMMGPPCDAYSLAPFMVSTTLVVNRCISALNGSLSVRNLIPGMKCSQSGKPLRRRRASEIVHLRSLVRGEDSMMLALTRSSTRRRRKARCGGARRARRRLRSSRTPPGPCAPRSRTAMFLPIRFFSRSNKKILMKA
jgi:hypothetical protein